MIKAIIFDWFGVCTKENWSDCLARKLHAILGKDEATIKEKFKPFIQPFARNELSPDNFLNQFIGSLDKKANPREFKYLFNTIPELNAELLNYIKKIKKKCPVYLLSNNFGPVFPNYEKQINFADYFTDLFLSHKLNFSKTQGEIWEAVLPKFNFKPEELLFIDNKDEYIQVAKKFGVNSILFKNNAQIKQEIEALLN